MTIFRGPSVGFKPTYDVIVEIAMLSKQRALKSVERTPLITAEEIVYVATISQFVAKGECCILSSVICIWLCCRSGNENGALQKCRSRILVCCICTCRTRVGRGRRRVRICDVCKGRRMRKKMISGVRMLKMDGAGGKKRLNARDEDTVGKVRNRYLCGGSRPGPVSSR